MPTELKCLTFKKQSLLLVVQYTQLLQLRAERQAVNMEMFKMHVPKVVYSSPTEQTFKIRHTEGTEKEARKKTTY